MVAEHNYTWEQGSDLVIEMIYEDEVGPVDLTNYSLRMDIAPMTGNTPGAPIYMLNSTDADAGDADEAILGSDGSIEITISRTVTLPGTPIGDALANGNVFGYDLFLRDNNANRQKKILKGNITVNKSITLWA